MITLRRWLRRVIWYCLLALVVNFLMAMSILFLPIGALAQHILGATFSIILLVVAVVILVQAIDGVGLLLEAGVRTRGEKKVVAFLVSVALIFVCAVLAWLLIVRLHQPFGDFLRGSDALLMQVEIVVIGALAWREAHRMRIQQQQKP
jgi:hypothetical protein